MKGGSTLFLRIALIIIALGVLTLCVALFPEALKEVGFGGFTGFFVILYLAAIPFFFALYQAWKLLSYIDHNTAFSGASIIALDRIKYAAAVIAVLYAGALPYMFRIAQMDDAPGVMVIGLICTGGPIVIAVFAAILKNLLKNAIAMKAENELTV